MLSARGAGTRRRRSARARAPRRRAAGSAGTASTLGSPISAFSAAGVPSATIRPWSMIPTRSASASASSRYWVVRKTVTPSSLARRSTSSHSAAAALRVEAGGGLVEEQDPRPVHQRQRQVEPALHAARVAAHLAVGRLGQAHALDQLVAAALALGLGQAVQRGLQAHVLARGQERVERGLLQRGADVLAHLRAVRAHLVAGHARRALVGRQQRGEHQHGGGLARAVGAEEAVDLARLHVEVDAVDGARALLELLDEALDLDRGRVLGDCSWHRQRYQTT